MSKPRMGSEVRSVLERARDVAHEIRHDYIGTEHLLLAAIRARPERFARVPDSTRLEAMVLERLRPGRAGRRNRGGELPLTSRAKKVLELAWDEARGAGSPEAGLEHLVVGLIREEKGIAADVLRGVGLDSPHDWTTGVRRDGASTGGFEIRLEDASERTFYEQIVHQVREAVASGGLAPGDKLPSVRRLADALDLAPGTVARAYKELEELGTVETDGARGTRVAYPGRGRALAPEERVDTLTGMLRPVAIAAFHLGAREDELRAALDQAVRGVFELA